MQFSSAISMMISRPSAYIGTILKTPSMRGYVVVDEVTYESSAAGEAFEDAFPSVVSTPVRGSVRRYTGETGSGIQVYDGSQWNPAAQAVAVTFFENDLYDPDDDNATSYRFYAAVDAEGHYWWSRGTGTVAAFTFDPQLFGLVAMSNDWDRVDSSALEALHSTSRW